MVFIQRETSRTKENAAQGSLHEVERKDVWGIYEPDRKFFLLEWVVTRL